MPSVAELAKFFFELGTACLVLGLSVLGILSMSVPKIASELYGLPAADPSADAWVAIAGLRDLGLALTAFFLHRFERRSLRVFGPTLLIIPIGDALLTYKFGGTVMGALTHLGGVFAIGVWTACAWLNEDLDARVKTK